MQVLADRYELGDPVGAGGMARVLEARDLLLERPVAVKLLREGLAGDDEVRERFLREARTAAQFNHPNAVAVFDSGDHNGDPWIVMELVQGEDLHQHIRRTGPLPERSAIRIADSVLAALEAAHRDGFVHRDVKPANIMLLDDGSVKLADFGIAKSIQDAATNITATGQILGTARYLSPEQVNGQPASAASDVYAMGIVLYEMLAGAAPFAGSDPIRVAVAHTVEPVPDVAAALPHVSPDIAGVIVRALAKDPADRYPDAGQMRHALLGDTRPQPVAAATLGVGAAAAGRSDARAVSLEANDDPTLDPHVPAAATRRRPPWLLLGLIGLALVAIMALVAASVDSPPPEITTDDGAAADPAEPQDPDEVEPPAGGAGDAAPPAGDAKPPKPPKPPKDTNKGNGKAKGKDKAKDKNNGKAKGRKD